jgi:hypothetical protein
VEPSGATLNESDGATQLESCDCTQGPIRKATINQQVRHFVEAESETGTWVEMKNQDVEKVPVRLTVGKFLDN